MNVRGFSDVRQTEIHTAEPLVPEPSAFEVELAIEKLKKTQITRYSSNPSRFDYSGGGGWTIRSDIHDILFLFGIRRNYARSGRSLS